ncbi:MAG: ABC transporter substrate-binding protein [Anaerolineae bacterium]
MRSCNKLMKVPVWIGLVVGVLLLAAACVAPQAPPPAAPEPAVVEEAGMKLDLSGQSVKFSSEQPHTINTTFFKMTDLLKEWGADVELIFHAGGTFGIATVLAGEVDVAENDTDELLLGIAQGAEVRAFMTNTAHMDYVLITTEDIAGVADLKGKDIGMSGPAGFDALLSRVTLEREGLDATDANFVQIGGSGDRATALGAGRIDAATIFVDDWLELEKKAENLHALVYMADIVPTITKGVYYAKTGWLENNHDMAVGIACAQLEANKWFHNNKQEWINSALEDVEGATEEAVTETYEILLNIDMFPRDGGFDPAGVERLMDIMVETGDLEEPLPVEQALDRSFLDEALEMGCGQ